MIKIIKIGLIIKLIEGRFMSADATAHGELVFELAQILSSSIGLFHLLWALYIVWGALCG